MDRLLDNNKISEDDNFEAVIALSKQRVNRLKG